MPIQKPSTSPRAGIIPGQRITHEKLERARALRQQMTPDERSLWQELRGNKLGAHFRRQQIIAGFIADFYCHKAGLVIEVDGGVHQSAEQKEYDAGREKVFSEMGFRVLRLRNAEVEQDLPEVLERIRELVGSGGDQGRET